MPHAIAVIPTDLKRSRLGLPSRVGDRLAGRTVLEHTLARVARIDAVRCIVLIHPADQDPRPLFAGHEFTKPVHALADPGNLTDDYHALRTAARKWALSAWRGGLGAATCYDELLPAGPILAALDEHKAGSALLVGADWPLVDPGYCQRVLELNLAHPEAMKMTFTQAPPGLGGAAVSRELIRQMVNSPATFGHLLNYDPTRPQADPIGRDVCVQVPASVRCCAKRFIYDTPRSAALIDAIADRLDHRLTDANADEITQATAQAACGLAAPIPQQVTLELTPQRLATGPITPQHHATIDRDPIELDTAVRIVEQLGAAQDVALTLGGLGDALLHEQWDQIVTAAHDAGVLGIAIETDLLVERPVVERLLEVPIDIVTVRLNADTAATYRKVMGCDEFKKVTDHLQWLLTTRNRRGEDPRKFPHAKRGVPWLVPRMVKTAQTLGDMESFYDRWVHFAGHAVIEPAGVGNGSVSQMRVPRMAPPRRFGCRQIANRMTIHADGRVARCDQDWHAKAAAGKSTQATLAELWQSMQPVRVCHEQGQWNDLELCRDCHQWHRP